MAGVSDIRSSAATNVAASPNGEPPLGGLVSPLAAAVFASMLREPLRRRTCVSTGIAPRNAAELRAAFDALDRVGEEWMRSRRSISVVPRLPRLSTEIAPGSTADMEIDTEKAAELLRLTDSRVRQLLRSGELLGRKAGRRWVVKRSAVAAYAGTSRKAAA
jgi:excisionase family DNA binding protein